MARTGIGANYVRNQMAAGRSMASIQAEAASRGYTVGPAAAAMFAGGGGGGGGGGGSSAPAPAASSGRTGIGASYVQKQLDAGRSLQDIKSEAARRGYTIGAKAQSMFDNAAKQGTDYSASRGLPPTGRFFDPTNYSGAEDQMGSGGFGLSALQRARQAGYTDAQIRTTLAGAGVEIGGKAADALNVAAGKTFTQALTVRSVPIMSKVVTQARPARAKHAHSCCPRAHITMPQVSHLLRTIYSRLVAQMMLNLPISISEGIGRLQYRENMARTQSLTGTSM